MCVCVCVFFYAVVLIRYTWQTLLTALRQCLIRVVAAVIVRVTSPFRLDTVAVVTLELVLAT